MFGNKGEHLKGDLVKDGDMGRTVELEASFFLGENLEQARQAEAKRKRDQLAEARAIIAEVVKLEGLGRGMDGIRRTDDLAKLKQCGNQMRGRQPKAKELRTRAEALPLPLSVSLRAATTNLAMCVSCKDNAKGDCDLVKSSLTDARKEIAEWEENGK